MTLFVCMHAGEEDVQDFVAWFNDEPIGVFVYKRDSVLYLCVEKETLRKGLRCVSMMKLYLHSSQQRVSELLIHWCRQAWCTKRRLPVHLHGMMRGHSSSPSLWQILHTQQTFNRIPFNMFSLCFLFFSLTCTLLVHHQCTLPVVSRSDWTPLCTSELFGWPYLRLLILVPHTSSWLALRPRYPFQCRTHSLWRDWLTCCLAPPSLSMSPGRSGGPVSGPHPYGSTGARVGVVCAGLSHGSMIELPCGTVHLPKMSRYGCVRSLTGPHTLRRNHRSSVAAGNDASPVA